MTIQNTPASIETVADYQATIAALQAAAAAYENTDQLLMTDAEYDAKLAQLAAYEDALGITPAHSLHAAVASGASVGGDVTHPQPMLSLDKPGASGVVEFAMAHPTAIVEPKIDGLAIRAVYRDGKLVQAVRRGDGQTGEDVTDRMVDVDGLPAVIAAAYPSMTRDFEVRGEIYLSDEKLIVANAIRIAQGKEPFANARNGVAGMVNKKDDTYAGLLSFAAYGTDFAPEADHLTAMNALSRMTFVTAYSLLPQSVVTADSPMAAIEQLGLVRPLLGFLMDGAVVKVATAAERKALGEGSRAPKWAVAYKYAAVEGLSFVEDIELNIGKTGRLSLRARIVPVEVDGSTVTYASLHNVGWLQAADIRIGSRVVVFKANDIIPQVRLAPGYEHPADSTPWAAPEVCPQCGESFDKSTELWRCTSPECSVVGRIIYGASRDAGFDIEGLGSVVAEALVEAGLAKDIADLFALTEAQLANLPLGGSRTLGSLNAAKIMAQIEQAKSAPLAKVITSLSMRHTGRTFGRRLAAHFKTMAALRAATVSQLANVEGIGDGKAVAIHAALVANADILDRMAAAGVNMGAEPAADDADRPAPFAGRTYVVSGTIPGYTRDQAHQRIEELGGKASGSVSATTTAVIGDKNGTSGKIVKANKLGKPFIEPVDFAAMLAG